MYLNEASLGVYRFEQVELAAGGNGYVLSPGSNDTQGWMENIMHIAACKYYLASGDQGVLPLLTRMRDFYKSTMCILPWGTMPNVTLPMVKEHWSPPPGTSNASVHHDWAMSESFAYDAVVFNSASDYAWSKLYHDCVSRYWQRERASRSSTSSTRRPIRRSRSVRRCTRARRARFSATCSAGELRSRRRRG